MRKLYMFFVFGLMTVMMRGAYAEDFLNAKTLLARCENEDPVALVDEITLHNKHGDWDEMVRKVATGDSEWIATSGCLMAGARKGSYSAIAGTSLRLGWIDVLPKNPTAFLQLEYQGYSLGDLCELPHIEPEKKFLAQYVKDTLSALDKVNAPHLQEGKQRCMKMMKDAFENPNRCKFINEVWHCPAKE